MCGLSTLFEQPTHGEIPMIKKLAIAISAAAALGSASLAQAEAFDTPVGELDVSMGVTLATDYIWRGQSQTAGTGAVQGSLDIGHSSGLYIGTWASNVDADAFGGSVEIDYYVGYGSSITDDISYDLSWNTYTYPNSGGDNVDEWVLGFDLYGLSLTSKYAYEPSSSLYLSVGYGFELPYDMGLGLHFGQTDTKDPLSAFQSKEKYNDWAVTLSKTVLGLDMALMYSDTNLKGGTCAAWYGKSSYCDSNVTFSVSKSL